VEKDARNARLPASPPARHLAPLLTRSVKTHDDDRFFRRNRLKTADDAVFLMNKLVQRRKCPRQNI
jgi:hypothetical protein